MGRYPESYKKLPLRCLLDDAGEESVNWLCPSGKIKNGLRLKPGNRGLHISMKLRISLFLLLAVTCLLLAAVVGRSVMVTPANSNAVYAVNALGIDLLRHTAQPGANALLSPYSIQMALVMTCAGADGQTRDEMVRVLHYPQGEDHLNRSFANLQTSVNGIMGRDSALALNNFKFYKEFIDRNAGLGADGEEYRSSRLPYLNSLTNSVLTLTTVNRLYGQSGYEIRPAYLKLLADNWNASLESVDFVHNASAVTAQINSWVQDQTHDRIQNLIPDRALDKYSRLVLVNVIYLKAPWKISFSVDRTQPGPFHLSDGTVIQVPTMSQPHQEGFTVGYAQGAVIGVFWGTAILSSPFPTIVRNFSLLF